MEGTFIEADDPRWAAFLEEVPNDIYHLPGYAMLAAAEAGARPLAYLGGDGESRILIPLLERDPPAGLGDGSPCRDLISPYGYASPLLTGDPDRFAELLQGFAAACASEGRVSAFLRSHPMLPPAWPPALGWEGDASEASLVSRGETVLIDLHLSPAELRSQLRTDHRRGIDRLRKRGYFAVVDDWSLYDRFIELYRLTMSRVHAAEVYFFSEAYFREIPRRLGGGVHLISVLDPEGAVVAGGLFFRRGEIVQYHLGASDPATMKMSPSKLTMQAAVEWGREAGARWLHLGGGLGVRDDALLWFKAGFSPLRRHFATLGVVADRAAYARLVARSGAAVGGSFFPAYRAPGTRPAAAAAEEPARAEA